MTYTTDTSIYTYTLSFKCSERRKCLAQIGLKKHFLGLYMRHCRMAQLLLLAIYSKIFNTVNISAQAISKRLRPLQKKKTKK